MKGTRILGIIAILAIVGFLFTACDNTNNGDNTPTLESITVNYEQGGTVYPSTPFNDLKEDLTVTANYSDGSNSTVTNYSLSGELTAGTSEITVTYQEKTAKFNVIVTAAGVTLTGITAEFNQSGIVYPSAPLDDLKHDLTVTGIYSDDTEHEVHGYTLEGILEAGECEITVIYEGKTATFNVNVTDPAVVLLNITAVYEQGDKTIYTSTPLNDLKQDLTVMAHFSDEGENYNPTGYELSGTLVVGTSIITVTYSGKTATFEVSVSIEYVTITWHFNGGAAGSGALHPTQIEKGGTLAAPILPTKNNCNFNGWYSDSALMQSYTFGTVNSNLNLYAKWQQITLQFYWGNFIPSTIVQATDLAASPVFNIDELVANVNNARKRVSLTSGAPVPTHTNAIIHQGDDADNSKWDVYNNAGVLQQTGTTKSMTDVRWEEIKSSEEIDGDKSNVTISGIGYLYLVSPKKLKEINNAGVNAISNFNEISIKIDDMDYFLYYFLAASGGTLELGLGY